MGQTSEAWAYRLKNPDCYSHSVDHVQLVETHISWVFLTGQYAYKIKKPVKYSFVDFSTLEKRQWFCKEEVRLNQRLAPEVYLEVVSITGLPTTPHIDGQGEVFEYAVKMKQFSSQHEIHHILDNKEQSQVFIAELADRIAQFHAQIEKADEQSVYGNPDIIRRPMKECLDEIPRLFLAPKTRERSSEIDTWLQAEWRNVSDIILHRKQAGFVRECHGDLHLGNIALFEGNVCVFDALEFEPCLRWIDVMSEVAFLVMDLEKYGHTDLGFLFLNRYLELTGDYEGLKIFRLYQVYRALVRSKVAGLRLAQLPESSIEKEKIKSELVGYLDLAHHFISNASPVLILMHGISGSGKTTVSTEIVKAPGVIRLRSDVERKRLFAKRLKPKTQDLQDANLYHLDVTEHTYEQLRDSARILIQAGFSVVVDATFLRHHQRELFRMLAKELACAWFIVDVFAPEEILVERIERRSREGHDASDATVAIMERQREIDESFTPAEQADVIRVDSTDRSAILSAIRIIIERRGFKSREFEHRE